MTTKTPTNVTTANDPATVLEALKTERAAMLDSDDVPGNWTDRQRRDYENRRRQVDQHITNWPAWRAEKPRARRDAASAALTRLTNAEVEIDRQLVEATAVPEASDAQTRDTDWGRVQQLEAAKVALRRGVNFIDGAPMLPTPLRALLTDTCVTCGRGEVEWHGSIVELEAARDTAQRELDDAEFAMASHVGSARELLAERPATV